jgi:hypothetical protein
MKKLIFLLSIFWFGLNFISAEETLPNEDSASNPFYTVNEKNLYMYDSLGFEANDDPPPPPGDGGGGYTSGAPASVISMYLPLLFLIGVYMIYKTKIKPIK